MRLLYCDKLLCSFAQSATSFTALSRSFTANAMTEEAPRKRSRFDQTEPEPRKASRFDRRSRSPASRLTESRRSRSPLDKDSQSPAGEKRSTPLDPAAAAGMFTTRIEGVAHLLTKFTAAAAAKINADLQARKGIQHVDVPPIRSVSRFRTNIAVQTLTHIHSPQHPHQQQSLRLLPHPRILARSTGRST